MDWDKLRIFHAVAEAGSFTHAGHDLGLSQSAVSRQISSLEQDLNVALFHRHARGLILTEFTDLFPQIQVTLMLDDRELDLAMREADVAIRLRRPVQPDLIQRKLFTVHHHVYASPEYVRRKGIPRALDDLDTHSILIFGQAPTYLEPVNWLETAGREEGSPRPAVLRVNSAYGLRRAVEAGVGMASLPDYIVGKETSLVQINLSGETPPQFDTYFVYPEELK